MFMFVEKPNLNVFPAGVVAKPVLYVESVKLKCSCLNNFEKTLDVNYFTY